MSDYVPKDNSATLFINDKKQSPNQPDRRGDGMVGGVPVWVSGWIKKTKNGQPFLSLAFTPKDEARQSKPAPKRDEPADAPHDDNIPF